MNQAFHGTPLGENVVPGGILSGRPIIVVGCRSEIRAFLMGLSREDDYALREIAVKHADAPGEALRTIAEEGSFRQRKMAAKRVCV